jgi:TolB-like protein/Tfp pilus assembly protein PilF
MEVLVCLASQPGEPVSKETILKTVWPETFVSDDVLTRSVSELRRVLEDDPRAPRFIETIPKRGYRLVAAVTPVHESLPLHDSSQAATDDPHSRKGRAWLAIASLVPLCGVLLGFNVGRVRTRIFGGRPPIRSLAVLPLQSLSTDPSQEYFAEGMTDALITDLAQIRALKVVSRTTIMRYGRPDKPLPQVARELNVDGIVEGTIQRSGDRVRITAQLIDGPNDEHVWADSFERDVKDALDVQKSVANEIASQIQIKITPEEQANLKSLQPVNPRALDAYVQARFHLDAASRLELYKGKRVEMQEHLRAAEARLDNAIQQDPNYMPAYVGYWTLLNGAVNPRLEFLPKTKSVLTRALELDDTDVGVHIVRAKLLMQYEYDWPGAEGEYRRALELSPNSADAHFEYSEYLRNVDRKAEGSKEFELAQELNPAHDYSADATNELERAGKTLEQQRQALEEQSPNDPVMLGLMGKNYAISARFNESVEMYERSDNVAGWNEFAEILKRADAQGGPKFALEEGLRAGEKYSKTHDDLPLVVMAFTYASLGNKDRAFAWLYKAVEQRSWLVIYLKRDNVWDPLRTDPRFAALLKRVGLPL